tara:strand:- start:568 stop:1806 length:1239 start_codon:yes stop_codon:yes gene_type:complete
MNEITNFSCRFCDSQLDTIFLDLGITPSANSFLKKENLSSEKSFPLRVFVCNKCLLVQLPEIIDPNELFSDYAYFSSFSETWLKHAEDYVDMMIRRFDIKYSSKIMEIASNDGYLLKNFVNRNIPVLGIEPASNVADTAIKNGIPTLKKFFSIKTANEIKEKNGLADFLIGNNVLAHVPNINDFISGMKILLSSNGIITMEFPHILQLIKNNEFDTIYHEHFSYFSFITVQKIFNFHELEIFDVEEISTHGGSLRIFVKHQNNKQYQINDNIENLIKKEKEYELDKISTYQNFSEKVQNVKKKLNDFIQSVNKEGKSVVCYGAPAKGNTLLNFCEINNKQIDFVVDRSPHKQGLFLPGSHIQIKSVEVIQETKPDYIIILPWNIKDEIMEQISFVNNWGGKFVIPIPEVKIL